MKAMIMAAGLGTRLRPLTNHRPKALVEVNGRTLLEITIARLRQFGVSEIIVNAHHFADQMIEYLKAKNHFGIRIEVYREDVLLVFPGRRAFGGAVPGTQRGCPEQHRPGPDAGVPAAA